MAKVAPPRPIKLYSNNRYPLNPIGAKSRCPFAARSRLALAEANAEYEEIEIDLQNKPDWYLKLNPVSPFDSCIDSRMEKSPLWISEVLS
jgi:glutaredoxin